MCVERINMANQTEQKIHAFVISLPSATKRRAFMQAQLDELEGVPFSFCDAVDGRGLKIDDWGGLYDDAKAQRVFGRSLTGPEIGCALSHLHIYERVLELGLDFAIVFEDDALIGSQFPDVLGKIRQQKNKIRQNLILLSNVGRYSLWQGRLLGKHHHIFKPFSAFGAHAYIITAEAARALKRELSPVFCPADNWKYIKEVEGVRLGCVVPYCVGVSLFERKSDIGRERFNARSRVGLRRFVHKYIYRKFLFQLIVKPFLLLKSCRPSW